MFLVCPGCLRIILWTNVVIWADSMVISKERTKQLSASDQLKKYKDQFILLFEYYLLSPQHINTSKNRQKNVVRHTDNKFLSLLIELSPLFGETFLDLMVIKPQMAMRSRDTPTGKFRLYDREGEFLQVLPGNRNRTITDVSDLGRTIQTRRFGYLT